MVFLERLLSPFILLIKHVFLFSYNILGDYGLAIILLSFFISLILLPVFIFIERAKKKDDAIKLKMKPLIDEIKRCYKGQERFYYLKTLNRQFNYSPLRALIPVLSLLLQIPFFIAAYQYLEGFEPLRGIDFLFIRDLSLPDAALGGLNVLPIAMTLVNLVTAYFYTRQGDGSERKQMLIVAGIFLVLLYNLPSGLVLYWTMNNVFSFFRLFITNPEVFKKVERKGRGFNIALDDLKSRFKIISNRIKWTFYFTSLTLVIGQLNWAFHNDFSDIILRILLAILVSFGFILVLGSLILFHKVDFNPLKDAKKDILKKYIDTYKVVFVILLVTSVLSQVYWGIQVHFNTIVQRIIICIFGTITVTSLFAILFTAYYGQLQFFRKIYEGKSVFSISKASAFWKEFSIVFIILLFFQLNWAIQNSFSGFYLRILGVILGSSILTIIIAYTSPLFRSITALLKSIKIPPFGYLIWFFVALYFFLSGSFYYKQLNEPLLNLSLFFIIAIQVSAIAYFIQVRKELNTILRTIIYMFFFIVFVHQFLSLYAFFESHEIQFKVFNFLFYFDGNTVQGFSKLGLLNVLLVIPVYFKRQISLKIEIGNIQHYIFSLFVIYILGLIFIWSPIIVFSSHPQNFNFPAINLIHENIKLFLGAVGIILTIYFTIKPIRYYLFVGFLFFTIVFFLYSSVIPFNVGTLQESFFSEDANLAVRFDVFIIEVLLLISILFLVKWILKKKYFKELLIGIIILNVFSSGYSLYLGKSSGYFTEKMVENGSNEKKVREAGSISFSKEKENIVIFMIDAAQGWLINTIFEENPSLQEAYDGFVYYPNTVSSSNFTYSSYPSMMNGSDYSVGNMNLDSTKTITEKITEATELFYNRIKNQGYSFTSSRMKYSNIDDTKFDSYIPAWDDKWTELMGFAKQNEIWYTRLWENALFSSVPIFLKAKIYNNQNWVVKGKTNLNSSELSRYHFVNVLPKISNTNSESSSFIYLHSMFTHTPWHYIDEKGNVIHNVSPSITNEWFIKEFVAWIDWMKENDVYDNTKIVLVSDHGPSYYHYKGKIEVDAPIVGTDFKGMSLGAFYRLNNLLMVKDFNKKGKVFTDWRLMSNVDTYAIAFDDNDPTKGPPKKRKVKTYYTKWHQDLRTRTKYKNIHVFEIEDNVYDLNNWKKLNN